LAASAASLEHRAAPALPTPNRHDDVDSLLTRLLRLLDLDTGWREVRRTVPHPVFGELRFVGRRTRPDGPVNGLWEVTPPGFARRVTVGFPMPDDGTPTAEDLAWLEEFFRDLDGFFERIRPAVAEEYAHWVGEPLPADWRAAFRLDDVELPGADDEDPEAWQVTYWCEGAQHWFVVDLRGAAVIRVEVDG
jgi:hypothetical protein